jgi:hypothetical protein
MGIGCGGLVLASAVLFAAFPARQILFPVRYDVVSIKTAPEYKDQARIDRAHALPAVSSYPSPPLYQSNGSLCGPTSVANVLRSFGTSNATAAGVLAGSGKCSLGFCPTGLILEEVAELARRPSGYRATVLRDLSIEEFRVHLARSSDPNRRYILNFDRGPLFGKAGGHHSPIGGYLREDDLVLVLDVNAEYEPWLVKADRLFTAMDTVDSSTRRKRGLVLVEKELP